MPKLFIVVNEDRFFLSHRKPVALAARDAGYETVIVTKDTGHRRDIEDLGFRVIDLPIDPTGMNPLHESHTFSFLLNLYRCEEPDIVHHVGLKNILWGGLAAKLLGVHGVLNAVSGLGGLFNDGSVSVTTRGILALMRFSNSRRNVKVIFQNNEDESIFLRHKVVMPEQMEFTKGSGIDLNEYSYVPEPEVGVDPPAPRPIRVIFTARMVREKGVCDLISAAEMLKPSYKDKVRFILCGRLTPNKTGIQEEYMREHCDGVYIRWLGERSDIKLQLEQSHIMAFPSYYREGVPKSLIEASAIGRPIITCDSVGCRDVVDDGANGFLISPRDVGQLADALRKLIDDPTLRRRMGKAARRKAEREFDISHVIDTHLRIYRQLALRDD